MEYLFNQKITPRKKPKWKFIVENILIVLGATMMFYAITVIAFCWH